MVFNIVMGVCLGGGNNAHKLFYSTAKTAVVEENSFEHGETSFENFEHGIVTAEHAPVQNGARVQEKRPEAQMLLR